MIRFAVLALLALPCALPAQAQTAPDNENGRFVFNKVDDGYLRLDSRTGLVSICARKPIGWACNPVPDERTALEAEIARLQTDNGILKREMLARGMPLPGTVKSEPQAKNDAQVRKDPPAAKLPDVELKLPSDSDLDRVFSFMDKVWRRLNERIGAIQRDYFGKT